MALTALYPGTFDPPTLGHIDVVRRCAPLFDKLYVGVGSNSRKRSQLFRPEERKALLQSLFREWANVEVLIYDGLLVDLVDETSIDLVIRSFRSSADADYEISMSGMNRSITGVETLFLPASAPYRDISSTLIREIGSRGRNLERFVPNGIEPEVRARLVEWGRQGENQG